MDFKFLYNQQRHLFAVGFNLSLGRLDSVHYDLLASEACLTSFLAVARGRCAETLVSARAALYRAGNGVALLSWGGTMFEYLMPRLLLPLSELFWTKVAVRRWRQIEYGRQCGVPRNFEFGFAAMDTDLNYQYQSFGVPGLGIKRGLANDLVIAPYSTMLAVMICPRHVVKNLRRLAAENAEGTHGFYEALDFTRDRLPAHARSAIVKCFMAHHQGMSLLALANCLLGDPYPPRFHNEPMVRATELLLQERIPGSFIPFQPQGGEDIVRTPAQEAAPMMSRRITTPHTAHPRTHLLSSSEYTAMVTNAGGSRSTWRGLDVTRWRGPDLRLWGQFCYLRAICELDGFGPQGTSRYASRRTNTKSSTP